MVPYEKHSSRMFFCPLRFSVSPSADDDKGIALDLKAFSKTLLISVELTLFIKVIWISWRKYNENYCKLYN